jgi:hypothetical protein
MDCDQMAMLTTYHVSEKYLRYLCPSEDKVWVVYIWDESVGMYISNYLNREFGIINLEDIFRFVL